MRVKISALVAALVLGSAHLVFAGGGADIGGGDLVSPANGSAWFVGSKNAIQACLQIAPNFGHTPQALQRMIQTAFSTWDDYIKYKGALETFPAEFQPSRTVSFSANCSETTDLVFYFGISNQEVDAYRGRFENPAAYAVRQAYDLRSGWGRGFIWIAHPSSLDGAIFPNFLRPEALQVLVTHEVGRVMGAGSHPDTITENEIVDRIKGSESNLYDLKRLNRIDYHKELVVCFACNARYPGFGPDAETSLLVTGKATYSRVSFRVGQMGSYRIVFEDAEGVREFPIFRPDSGANDSFVYANPYIFLIVKYNDQGLLYPSAAHIAAATQFGHIEAFDGKRYAVAVERNTAAATPVRVTLIDSNLRTRQLFRSSFAEVGH